MPFVIVRVIVRLNSCRIFCSPKPVVRPPSRSRLLKNLGRDEPLAPPVPTAVYTYRPDSSVRFFVVLYFVLCRTWTATAAGASGAEAASAGAAGLAATPGRGKRILVGGVDRGERENGSKVRARRSPGGLSGRSRRSLGFRSLDVPPLLLDLGRGRADLSIRSRKRENYMRRFSLATPIVSKNVPRAPGVVSRFSRHAQAPNEVIKPEVFQTSPLSISPPPLSPPYKLIKGLSTPTIYQSLLLPSLFGANLMAEVTEPH